MLAIVVLFPQFKIVYKIVVEQSININHFLFIVFTVIAAITVKTINKKWFMFILCSTTILYTILNWGNRTTIANINDKFLIENNKTWKGVGKDIGLEPSSPVWANFNKNIYTVKRTTNVDVLSGTGKIKQQFRNSTHHIYIADITSNSAIINETLEKVLANIAMGMYYLY